MFCEKVVLGSAMLMWEAQPRAVWLVIGDGEGDGICVYDVVIAVFGEVDLAAQQRQLPTLLVDAKQYAVF